MLMYNKKELLVSYGTLHELYLYKSPVHFRTVNAKSKYLDTFRYEQEDYETQQRTDGVYNNIKYDRFRNLYYRIVRHNQPFSNPDGTSNEYFDAPWSIIVLDKNLNVIDEISFKAREYILGRVVITKEGLLLTKRIQKGIFEKEDRQNIIYKLRLS